MRRNSGAHSGGRHAFWMAGALSSLSLACYMRSAGVDGAFNSCRVWMPHALCRLDALPVWRSLPYLRDAGKMALLPLLSEFKKILSD